MVTIGSATGRLATRVREWKMNFVYVIVHSFVPYELYIVSMHYLLKIKLVLHGLTIHILSIFYFPQIIFHDGHNHVVYYAS